jgi:hypothetical protein
VGSTNGRDKLAEHWKQLGLMSGAPECVIKTAHRFYIELHHPDRGGDVEQAQRVNVAYDELKGRGSNANEHVAKFYDGEPWHVLGVASNADRQLAERVARALASELTTHPRLAARVGWAMDHWGRPGAASKRPRVRVTPPPPTRRRAPIRPEPPAQPAAPGRPDGLTEAIDFGSLAWRSTLTRELRLTWQRFAPYNITVDAEAPLVASVVASKALPGRFVVSISIDWQSDVFTQNPTLRGYTMNSALRIRWPSGGDATVRVKGVLHYPAIVTASPLDLDLHTVTMQQPVRASLVLVSTASTSARITSSAWLARVDSAGKPLDAPLKLAANVPVRVAFDVQWPPIVERAATVAAGKPVRPTGKITVHWNDQQLEVPVQMVVQRPR